MYMYIYMYSIYVLKTWVRHFLDNICLFEIEKTNVWFCILQELVSLFEASAKTWRVWLTGDDV